MARIMQDGTAEDLIRSFTQIACAENHAKTILEKYEAQLENGLIDGNDPEAVNAQLEKINDIMLEINAMADLRRGVMHHLMTMYNGDVDYWCMVKHLAVGAYCAFEAYQASDDDAELYGLYLEANKRFIKAMSHFLGVEITECAACFADALKTKGDDNDTLPSGM